MRTPSPVSATSAPPCSALGVSVLTPQPYARHRKCGPKPAGVPLSLGALTISGPVQQVRGQGEVGETKNGPIDPELDAPDLLHDTPDG